VISSKLDQEIIDNAQILWDYLKLDQPLQKADCVIALGSHDLRVGRFAAQLILAGWAPLLVCSGGLGRLTREIWKEPEAELFFHAAVDAGIPSGLILVERQSTNTAENLKFSRRLLEEKGITVKKAILAHKPYMERRVLATAGVVWPNLVCIVSSPPIALTDYPTDKIPMDEVIQIMVGDFQRIIVYAEKGFQTKQQIPQKVLVAFNELVKSGFDQHCLNA
jgi:hypothetical protein